MSARTIRAALSLSWLCAAGCGSLGNQPFLQQGEGLVSGKSTLLGNPVGDVLVFAVDDFERPTRTAADGTFTLETAAGLDRKLVFLWGNYMGAQRRFDLASQGHQQVGEVEIAPLGTLRGEIRIRDMKSSLVEIEGTPFAVNPASDGKYALSAPPGSWTLLARAPGYLDERLWGLEIVAGGIRDLAPIELFADPGYSCQETRPQVEYFVQGGSGAVDVLFVIDNSQSMLSEQTALAHSIRKFTDVLSLSRVDYHLAVVTTGMGSTDSSSGLLGCPPCSALPGGAEQGSCINETGESGRFQGRRGKNTGTLDAPQFVFEDDPGCRVVTPENLSCFYDPATEQGTVFVGLQGCGYERGLASMKAALEPELLDGWNQGFLRKEARLAVVALTDEEDCGQVGDVEESTTARGDICYYAAKGVDPWGNTGYPSASGAVLPYQLTPVAQYARWLTEQKGSAQAVSFSAIVGVRDPRNPLDNPIEYTLSAGQTTIVAACNTLGCTGQYCAASPGTRYARLAELTGGVIQSICQDDYSDALQQIADAATGYRSFFALRESPARPEEIEVYVNRQKVLTGAVYDPAAQAIRFDAGTIPSPYSLVEIRYQTTCPGPAAKGTI